MCPRLVVSVRTVHKLKNSTNKMQKKSNLYVAKWKPLANIE